MSLQSLSMMAGTGVVTGLITLHYLENTFLNMISFFHDNRLLTSAERKTAFVEHFNGGEQLASALERLLLTTPPVSNVTPSDIAPIAFDPPEAYLTWLLDATTNVPFSPAPTKLRMIDYSTTAFKQALQARIAARSSTSGVEELIAKLRLFDAKFGTRLYANVTVSSYTQQFDTPAKRKAAMEKALHYLFPTSPDTVEVDADAAAAVTTATPREFLNILCVIVDDALLLNTHFTKK